MSVHSALIKLCAALGYPQDDDPGVCHGFAVLWLQACLLGKEEQQRFEARIKLIASIPTAELVEKLEQIKAKVIAGARLTSQECELLDFEIPNFCDSLMLFHEPGIYSFLVNRPALSQGEIKTISCLAASKQLLEKGGMEELYSDAFIWDEYEIAAYLGQLSELFDKFTYLSEEPIALLLGSEDHSLALTYQPGQGWTFRDIDQEYMLKESSKPGGNYKIALEIKKGFEHDTGSYSAFNVQLLLAGSDPRLQELKKELEILKQRHLSSITNEIACRQTNNGINLVYIAARYGHCEEIKALAQAEANLNQPNNEGITPVYIAAKNGFDEVIKVLVQYKAALNKAWNNVTPIHAASESGHVMVVYLLAQAGADLNKPNNDGATPLYIAAQNNRAAVVAVLLRAGANVNTPHKSGATPVYIAAQIGHAEVIKVLVTAGINLNQPCRGGATPIFIAAAYGHDQVVKVLLEARVDFIMSWQCTVSQLKHFCVSIPRKDGIEQRLSLFLNNKQDHDVVCVSPYQIAYIMGHGDVTRIIQPYLLEHIRELNRHSFFLEPPQAESTQQLEENRNTLIQ